MTTTHKFPSQVVRVPVRVRQVEDLERLLAIDHAAWRRRQRWFGHGRQQDLPLVVRVEGVVARLAEHEPAHLLWALSTFFETFKNIDQPIFKKEYLTYFFLFIEKNH